MAGIGTVIHVDRVSKAFGANSESRVQALRAVTLDVQRRELLSILGPTGCGKTTLLRIISKLDTPDDGSIEIAPSTNGSPNSLGFLFQQHALFPWMTVEKNILFGLRAAGLGKEEARARCLECLRLVGLTDSAKSFPYELSGGMQRRAALARTIAPRPDIVLMDEPFSGLDIATARALYDEMLRIHSHSEMTIVFVTHNIEEAVFLASRVIVMGTSPGRIVAEVPVDLPRPRDRLDRRFVEKILAVREFFVKANPTEERSTT
ncbi:MAG: ABC transporter ATP-binding protein [bacterium]